ARQARLELAGPYPVTQGEEEALIPMVAGVVRRCIGHQPASRKPALARVSLAEADDQIRGVRELATRVGIVPAAHPLDDRLAGPRVPDPCQQISERVALARVVG